MSSSFVTVGSSGEDYAGIAQAFAAGKYFVRVTSDVTEIQSFTFPSGTFSWVIIVEEGVTVDYDIYTPFNYASGNTDFSFFEISGGTHIIKTSAMGDIWFIQPFPLGSDLPNGLISNCILDLSNADDTVVLDTSAGYVRYDKVNFVFGAYTSGTNQVNMVRSQLSNIRLIANGQLQGLSTYFCELNNVFIDGIWDVSQVSFTSQGALSGGASVATNVLLNTAAVINVVNLSQINDLGNSGYIFVGTDYYLSNFELTSSIIDTMTGMGGYRSITNGRLSQLNYALDAILHKISNVSFLTPMTFTGTSGSAFLLNNCTFDLGLTIDCNNISVIGCEAGSAFHTTATFIINSGALGCIVSSSRTQAAIVNNEITAQVIGNTLFA